MTFRTLFQIHSIHLVIVTFLFSSSINVAQADDFTRFIGEYSGKAEIDSNGKTGYRDLDVAISKTKKGFQVNWKSVTHKPDGRIKEREYSINFIPSDRAGIYSSAMRTNVFGATEALDPLKGDPYVWARITADVLTVFSMMIIEDGGYEIQIYNRKLVAEGLQLKFQRHRNGEELKLIETLLVKK